MPINLMENTSKLGEENLFYFGNVPSKKRWQYPTNFDNILFFVIKNNNIFEL